MNENNFFKLLSALAHVSNFEIDEVTAATYDHLLSPLGYDRVCRALMDIYADRGSRDPFPSVKEIKERVEPRVSRRSQANEVAAGIIGHIARKGYTWAWPGGFSPHATFQQAVVAELGDVAWHTIRLYGGWQLLCEQSDNRRGEMLRAQLRDLATTVLEKSSAGRLFSLPELPSSVTRSKDSSLLPASEVLKNVAIKKA